MPLVQTRGAASAQGFGEFAQVTAANYIEDVFSTFLYTGNGATQTITNGIDLSTKGGLVWIKHRSGTGDHGLTDTVRGATKSLFSNQTYAELTGAADLTSFNTTGFSIGAGTQFSINNNNSTYASWTFRKQPKFFDVVTYTGTGSAGLNISHNLGSVPGTIIVKITSGSGSWFVYHRSLGATQYTLLDSTGAAGTSGGIWNNTEPTSSVFTLGNDGSVNSSGQTYVAYLVAHNAGGFGLTGSDNVISCGSFTTDGSGNATVSLGYEPQWLMVKASSTTGNWQVIDNMRGFSKTGYEVINVNTSGAASAQTSPYYDPSATGFSTTGIYAAGVTVIYIAIRRGPMKVPTTGTSVFAPITTSAATGTAQTTNFPIDMQMLAFRGAGDGTFAVVDRLRGISSTSTSSSRVLETPYTVAEAAGSNTRNWNNTGFEISSGTGGYSYVYESFRRAPSFMDVVCYTGTGSSQNVAHNLAVVPELLIIKRRNSTGGWEAAVPSTTAGSFFVGTSGAPISLNTTNGNGGQTAYAWASNTGTSTYFNPEGIFWNGNVSSGTYVAYLFATCAGVSKVGTYTGNGTSVNVDCGFTGGARFVLIKRVDDAGAWWVFDTARGINAANDPYLQLNTTNAENNGFDMIDPYAAGFTAVQASVNTNGANYIFLAIA